MRANTSVPQRSRYTKTLENFRGVDLSSSPLRVAPNRAMYMRNFICENGINHKRPGWQELLRIEKDEETGEEPRINGIHPYGRGALVHAGKRFYFVDDFSKEHPTVTELNDIDGVTNTRSVSFAQGNRLFLVGCGVFLVFWCYSQYDPNYFSASLKPVSEYEGTYVPTTTISIDAKGKNDPARATLDAVNITTGRRKNTLVGKSLGYSDMVAEKATWRLDAEIAKGTEVKVDLGSYEASILYNENGSNTEIQGKYSSIKITVNNTPEKGETCGEITIEAIEDFSANGSANITVTFTAAEMYENAKRRSFLNSCTIGTLFGANGASDRLFLSGSATDCNYDMFSEADDFTYFPDNNRIRVGSTQSSIVGYARLSDSTLAVLKSEARGEPSIYYRTGTYENDARDTAVIRAVFRDVTGSSGESITTAAAIANLAGDDLILTPRGVYGIVLSSNVASGERYTVERSRPIRSALAGHDLTKAVATVWRGRYYLALENENAENDAERYLCYVADSRYQATFDGSTDTNYEWWVWNNVPSRVFAVINDRLFFGTADGRICSFVEGTYTDRAYEMLGEGDLLENDGSVTYSERLSLRTGKRVVLDVGAYTELTVCDEVDDDGRIVASEDLILRLYDGLTVYADNVGSSGLEVGTPYYVTNVDAGALRYRLMDVKRNIVNPTEGGFRLSRSLHDMELFVGDVEEGVFWFADSTGARLPLIHYNDTQPVLTGTFLHEHPVVAEWVTPAMDLGTNANTKSLLAITISTEPTLNGNVTFGYETRKLARTMQAQGVRVFSFNDLDFNNFTFNTGFTSAYTKRLFLRHFNYIQLHFGSAMSADCAVNGLTLTYRINQQARGTH